MKQVLLMVFILFCGVYNCYPQKFYCDLDHNEQPENIICDKAKPETYYSFVFYSYYSSSKYYSKKEFNQGKFITNNPENFINLKKLRINDNERLFIVNDYSDIQKLSLLPNLEYLYLERCDLSILSLFANCEKLKTLVLKDCYINDILYKSIVFHNYDFRNRPINYIDNFNEKSINYNFRYTDEKNFDTFYLDTTKINEICNGMVPNFFVFPNSLIEVLIDGFPENKYLYKLLFFSISKLPNLKKLSSPVFDKRICTLSNLEELNIGKNNDYESDEYKEYKSKYEDVFKIPDEIGNMIKLKSLTIRGEAELPEIIGNLLQLQKIEIYRSEKLPLSLRNLKNLEELRLYYIEEKEKSILQIFPYLTGLKKLTIGVWGLPIYYFLTAPNLEELQVFDIDFDSQRYDRSTKFQKYISKFDTISYTKKLKKLFIRPFIDPYEISIFDDYLELFHYERHDGFVNSKGNYCSLDFFTNLICKMTELEELYIFIPRIESANFPIGNLKKLKRLSLLFDFFDTIPASIGHLDNLEYLYLRKGDISINSKEKYTNFTTLPSEIGLLKKLKDFILFNCAVVSIDSSLCDLINLQNLTLRNCNSLKKLPMNMYSLKNLRTLQIINCPELCDLGNLNFTSNDNRIIYLQGIKINQLLNSLSTLRPTSSLIIDDLSIDSMKINNDFIKLTHLNSVCFYETHRPNQKEIPFKTKEIIKIKQYLPKTRVLPIDNSIESSPYFNTNDNSYTWHKITDKFNIKQIHSLKIDNNNIKHFPFSLAKMKNLESLYLNCDSLQELPRGLKKLKNLKYIRIDTSAIAYFPKDLFKVSGLLSIYINKINDEKLPDGIKMLKFLKYLNIQNAPFLVSLPQSIKKLNNLYGVKFVTADSLKDLGGLKEIKYPFSLDMGSTNVTNDLSYEISKCKNLVSLYTTRSSIDKLYKVKPDNLKQIQKIEINFDKINNCDGINDFCLDFLDELPLVKWMYSNERINYMWYPRFN